MRKVKGVFPLIGESDTGKDKTLSNTLEQAYPGRVALLPDDVLYGKDETKLADTALRQYAYKVLLLNNDVDLSKVPDQMLNKNLANCTAQAKRKAYDTQSVATSSLPATFFSVNDHNNRKMSDSVRNKLFPIYTSGYDQGSFERTPWLKQYTSHQTEADGENVLWIGDTKCGDMLAHAWCDNDQDGNGGPWRKAAVFIAFGLRVLKRDVEAFGDRGAYLPTLRYPQALLEQRNLRQGALPDPGKVGLSAPTGSAASLLTTVATSVTFIGYDQMRSVEDTREALMQQVAGQVVPSRGATIKPTDVALRMRELGGDVLWGGIGGPDMANIKNGSINKSDFGKDLRVRFERLTGLSWVHSSTKKYNGVRVVGVHIYGYAFANLAISAPNDDPSTS